MAIATDPRSTCNFVRINCRRAIKFQDPWGNRDWTRQSFVAIHPCDVTFLRRNKGQSTHNQSATGNSTAWREKTNQSLSTVHELAGRFPRRRFSAPIRYTISHWRYSVKYADQIEFDAS